jgi:hypothetical protein
MLDESKAPEKQEQPTQEELLARIKALEEANAAAEKEKDALEKKLKAKGKSADKEPDSAQKVDYLDERVKVRLFKDSEKYKDDVDICVNGERILIKRGVDVFIPRKHALILEQSLKQDDLARATIEAFEREYREREKSYT